MKRKGLPTKLKDTIHLDWYKYLFIVLVIGLCAATSAEVAEADILDVFGNLEQMSDSLSRFPKPDFFYISKLIGPIISTLRMLVVGTTLRMVFAVLVAFLGTAMVTGNRVVTSAIRSSLDIIHTMPNLLLTALTVVIVGIGEFTGVMTTAMFTSGLVSRLVYEAIEAIDGGPIETVMSVRINRVQVAFQFVAPQIMSQVAGYTSYTLEVSVRASAVLGYVGAGGIGAVLNSSPALLRRDRVSIIILLVLVVVTAVDSLSEAIRRRLA